MTYRSAWAVEAELLRLVRDARARGERPVVVVRSYDEEVRVKHLLADAGAGFGVAAMTFDGWIADLWELFGDGRALVAPLQRAVLMRRALEDAAAESEVGGEAFPLACTPGYARLLARAVREGFAAAARADASAIGEAERAATGTVLRYGDLLSERGLVEPTEACEVLADAGVLDGVCAIVLDVRLSELQLRFLDRAEAHILEIVWETEGAPDRPAELARLQHDLLDPDFDNPIQAEGHVRFALPSGGYAAARLAADEILNWFDEHPGTNVALAAPDPFAWFGKLAPRLAQAGVGGTVAGVRAFGQTPFGSAWCQLLRFATQAADGDAAALDVHLAGDFALSPFSALPPRMARAADSRFRGCRAQTADDAFTDLTAFADEDHRGIVSAFADGRFADALAAERGWVLAQRAWPAAERDGALAAISCAERVHEAAADAGFSDAALVEVLETQPIGASKEMPADGCDRGRSCCHIDFLTLSALGQKPASSYDCVMLVDLTASVYPLSDERDAADGLLDLWGAGPAALEARGALRTRTQLMQKDYAAALATARERIVLSRPLNTVDGDEERPSALFEELVDCYRRDPQNADEVDETTGLTSALSAFASQLGEEDAASNLACAPAAPLSRRIPLRPTGSVDSDSRGRILLPRVFSKGVIATEPYLSPSAIESYLECPHLWFARRRLRLDTVDADFGGLAFGNFAHGVLERLHVRLRTMGHRRVDEANVEDAVALMNGIFDDRFACEQVRFAKDALIPFDELERLEVEQLRRRLEALVRREARLLPDFAPLGEEIGFGEGDDEFVYAGVHVAGKVDRIDVDAYGRAVVIDYKGSVGREYAFRRAEDDGTVLPRKMQTLIYAQMARRKLGLIPVGAIYLSYGKDGAVRGLFDRTVLDGEGDLLGMDPKTCGTSDFAQALDAAEAEVERRIARLLAGEIPPAAADLKACEYCPVGLCERRDELAAAASGGGGA